MNYSTRIKINSLGESTNLPFQNYKCLTQKMTFSKALQPTTKFLMRKSKMKYFRKRVRSEEWKLMILDVKICWKEPLIIDKGWNKKRKFFEVINDKPIDIMHESIGKPKNNRLSSLKNARKDIYIYIYSLLNIKMMA